MHATLFSLVVTENPDQVFAWGMEIIDDAKDLEETRQAIVYVGYADGQGSISTHTSAESACKRWSAVVPLSIEWDGDAWADAYSQLSGSQS